MEEESKEAAAERERREREAEKQSEFDKLQGDRRLLPMFPYREQLLQAIAEHQVIIIVGETGSGESAKVIFQLLVERLNLHFLGP